MSELSDIAKKHLEKSDRTITQANRLFLIVGAILLLSHLMVIEVIFNQTKYKQVKLFDSKVSKQEILTDRSLERANNSVYKDQLKRSKEQLYERKHTIDKSIEDIIDKIIPKPFNALFAIAAIPQFGVLSISIGLTILMVVLLYMRRSVLKRIALALRMIQSDKGSFNKAYDYNISTPFWILPVPESANIPKKELLSILGVNHQYLLRLILVVIVFLLLAFLQLRMFYIGLVSIQSLYLQLLLSASVFTCITLLIYWFLIKNIGDVYNSEVVASLPGRRNFIQSTLILSLGVAFVSTTSLMKRGAIWLTKNPRFKRKKRQLNGNAFEDAVLQLLKEGKRIEAAHQIFERIKADQSNNYYNLRLYDLLAILCRITPELQNTYLVTLQTNLKNSGLDYKYTKSRIKNWEKHNWPRLWKYEKYGIKWNGIKI